MTAATAAPRPARTREQAIAAAMPLGMAPTAPAAEVTLTLTWNKESGWAEADRALEVMRALGHRGAWGRSSSPKFIWLRVVVAADAAEAAARVVYAACPALAGWSMK